MDEASDEWQTPGDVTCVDGYEDLITDPFLSLVGASFQVEWNLFVCCRTLLPAETFLRHLAQPGHSRATARVRDHIRGLIERWDVPNGLDRTPPTVEPRVAASTVHRLEGLYGCPHCPVTGGLKYVRTHLAKRPHPCLPDLPPVAGLVAHTINKTHYRVTERAPPADADTAPSFGAQLAAFDSSARPPATVPNARLVSPFLHRTKWHEVREPYSDRLPDLVALASFPREDEFRNLVDAVRLYFRRADGLFEHTEEVVLQRLNTPNPAKTGINNTPMHRHQNGDATTQQYVAVTIRLVAALLRRSDAFSLEPSQALAEAVSALRTSLLDDRQDANDAQVPLHDVFAALWRARWRLSSTSRMPDPTMRFLMLLSSKPCGAFAAPKDTSGPIRKLCWAIQLHALVEMHRLVDTELLPQVDAFERVAEYVVEKDTTTYAALWSLQHYTSALSMQTLSMPTIWWTDRERWTELLYKGHKITLAQVEELFTGLEQEIVDRWENTVLKGLDLRVRWSEIADDLTERRPGYSFLDDARNPFRAFHKAFAEALDDDLDARKQFTTAGSGHTSLDLVKCRRWLYDLAELEGLVMLLVDMLGGAPPRGTELVSMLARNTPFRLRNFCALGRHIAIIRQYDKTTNITQSDRLIPHSISAVAADVLIQIHAIARPWARFLASKIWVSDPSVARGYSDLLFMDFGRMFTSDKLSQLMGAKSGDVVGWQVKVSAWRHVNIAWRRKLCGGSAELLDQEATGGSVNALQGGHSARTENMVYGLSPDALAGAPEDVLSLFLLASGEWQKAARMVPGGLGLDYRAARSFNFGALVLARVITTKAGRVPSPPPAHGQEDETRALFEKQGETLSVLARIEARLQRLELAAQGNAASPRPPAAAAMIVDSARATTPCKAARATPSRDTPSRDTPSRDTPAKRQRRSTPLSERASGEEASPHGEIDVLAQVRRLLNDPTAGWKDATQYDGIRECLALQRDVVVTSRTGSGKTLIAVVPAVVEDAVTVIVVPLISLLEDWQRRLDRFGIPYERFEGAASPTIPGRANIVLVTSDVVKQRAWAAAVAELTRRRTISRVVFDEAHYYASDYEFRPEALARPYQLRGFNFQIVLLSATVPDAAFRFLAHQFELESPVRITSGSHRPELELVVIRECKTSDDQLERAAATLRRHVESADWRPVDRWIVFVSSLGDGTRYAQELGVPLYKAAKGPNRDLENARRQQIYLDWIAGRTVGLVATNALGAGNDYAHVRVTIHINTPFNASIFEQQRGRGGRDGERAHNYIIARDQPWVADKAPHPIFGDLVGTQVISDLVYKDPPRLPDRCLTFQLTSFFDGAGHTCGELLRRARCAGCRTAAVPESAPTPSIAPRFDPAKPLWCSDGGTASRKRKLEESFGPATHRAVKRSGLDLSAIQDGHNLYRRIFALVDQTCGVCLCFGVDSPGEHPIERCPILQTTPKWLATFREFKATVRYPPRAPGPCYTCHVASGGRDSLHPPFQRGAASCPNPRLALSIALGVYLHPEWRQRAVEYFAPGPPHSWDSAAGYAQWYTTVDKQGVWRSMAIIRFFGKIQFADQL